MLDQVSQEFEKNFPTKLRKTELKRIIYLARKSWFLHDKKYVFLNFTFF